MKGWASWAWAFQAPAFFSNHHRCRMLGIWASVYRLWMSNRRLSISLHPFIFVCCQGCLPVCHNYAFSFWYEPFWRLVKKFLYRARSCRAACGFAAENELMFWWVNLGILQLWWPWLRTARFVECHGGPSLKVFRNWSKSYSVGQWPSWK